MNECPAFYITADPMPVNLLSGLRLPQVKIHVVFININIYCGEIVFGDVMDYVTLPYISNLSQHGFIREG